MRPALAASYSQVRETPSRAATAAGLRRSGVLICWLLTWVIDREQRKTDNDFALEATEKRTGTFSRRNLGVYAGGRPNPSTPQYG